MKIQRVLTVVVLASVMAFAGCMGGAYTLANVDESGSKTLISREIAWDGSTSLTIDVPSVVRYVQAPGRGKVTARGPERSVSTLKVTGGHVHDQLLRTDAVLEILVMAPNVTRFHCDGRTRLSIDAYEQDSLWVSTNGTAVIDVSGRTRIVSAAMQGASSINLARLETKSVKGSIGGAGSLIAAPVQGAHLNVRNFASAVLLTRPAELTMKLEDSGRIIDAAPREY